MAPTKLGFLFLSSMLHPLLLTVLALPPSSPIQCNSTGCTLSNSYGAWGDRRQCRVPAVVYPTTEEELVSAVAGASRRGLKVKVVSGFSDTIPKLACPSSSSLSLLISTAKYVSAIEVDAGRRTVTADSGVGLRDLIDRVEGEGLSLVAAPYWEGVSVGGLVSTGSHGSSWWGRGGAVHDHVVGIRLVVPAGKSDGFAKVVEFGEKDSALNAVKVSLGLLGVISKVTLSLEPAFKRSISNTFHDDDGFQDEFMDLAREHEFSDITWYPSQRKAVYRRDDRVPLNSSGDGTNDFIGFQDNSVLISRAVRGAEKLAERMRSTEMKCAMAAAELAAKRLVGNGLKNSAIFTGYPVVGRQGKMQTSGSCLHSSESETNSMCSWDPRIRGGLFFYETTAIFPPAAFRDFILDVKRLRDMKPGSFCGVDIYNGFLIRFVKASAAYLGQPEDSVVVDFNYFRADDHSAPRLDQDVWEEVEQMAFFKHGARPHWGKNRKVAFEGVRRKYPSFGKFLEAKDRLLDPEGMFSNEWSDEVVMGTEGAKEDGCAMEGACICSEDRHCNPGAEYLCKPGLVYKEAKVCRHSDSAEAGPTAARV